MSRRNWVVPCCNHKERAWRSVITDSSAMKWIGKSLKTDWLGLSSEQRRNQSYLFLLFQIFVWMILSIWIPTVEMDSQRYFRNLLYEHELRRRSRIFHGVCNCFISRIFASVVWGQNLSNSSVASQANGGIANPIFDKQRFVSCSNDLVTRFR